MGRARDLEMHDLSSMLDKLISPKKIAWPSDIPTNKCVTPSETISEVETISLESKPMQVKCGVAKSTLANALQVGPYCLASCTTHLV